MLMSPDSSYSPSSSSGVQAKATSVLMVAPSSSSTSAHRSAAPSSTSNMMAPLNLQKFERPLVLGGGGDHHHYQQQHHHNHQQPQHHGHISKPTAIATAVIRVQVPECNSSGLMRHPASPPMVSVSTNNGNGSHSPFMVPQAAAAGPMYSNVIVMNKKLKPQPELGRATSPHDYAKSYPVMEPTVASSSSSSGNNNTHNYGKGEPELNIGMRLDC